MARIVALVDMDGTLADYEGSMLRWLEQLRSPEEPIVTSLNGLSKPLRNRMRLIKNSKDWWFDLEPIQSGFDVFKMLQELEYEIHILTKGPENTHSAWEQKIRWCRRHLGSGIKVTVTEDDKSLTYGRVLVDDWPKYMSSWLKNRPRGLGIMPTHPNNLEFSHKNVIKYDGTNKDKVFELLKAVRDRKPKESIWS